MPFYNFKNITETSADIEVYGEIVEKRPTNWWGDAVEGMFFVSSEFNEQIAKLQGVSNITLKINSPGGDLFVGVGVYNKLKSLNANITVIVEGLAASAAGLIACAGDTVKLGTGAVIMAHQASTFVPDWYVNETDIEEYKRNLEACNKAVAEIISEKTGKSVDEIMPLLKEEIWLSGQDAIDFGFADEMLNSTAVSGVSPAIDPVNNSIYSNGQVFAIKNYVENAKKHMPTMLTDNVKSPEKVDKTIKNKEDKPMPTPTLNLETLRQQYPQLVKEIEDNAVKNALQADRKRQQEIDEIAPMISDKSLVNEAKYGENATTAQQLLYDFAKNQKDKGADFFANVETDYQNSGAEKVEGTPNAEKSDDEKVADEINSAVALFNKNKGVQ